jgi:hypothetical protein
MVFFRKKRTLKKSKKDYKLIKLPSIQINKLNNISYFETIRDNIKKCKCLISSYFNATKKNLNESQEELVNTKPLSVESNQRLQQAKIQSDHHDIQVSFNFINIL